MLYDRESLKALIDSKESWTREDLNKALDRHPERLDRFSTLSDKEIPRLVGPEDMQDFNHAEALGLPGRYPYTRGVQPSMYRGRVWTMRQFAGFGTPADTNQRYRYLLGQGQTGLSVAFHYPTLMGLDSDHPRSLGEVGRCGVAVDSLRDMEVIFDGIPLDKVTTSMTINGPAGILLAMYIVVAEKQGVPADKIGGTIQNDILKEYIAQKSWIFPPRPSMRIITDILAYCTAKVPRWNTISISGYHIREAGSTAVQELAFTLADGIGYVQAGMDAGLDVDDFAPRLSYFFNAHGDFFEEIAKYRAARRMWAHLMKERFGAKKEASWKLRFHTQTAGCSLTAQQPMNNVVRTTLQALGAVLGGTQSLHTNSMDETFALPTENSVLVALRTQQIIAEESGVTNTIDPLGGSYFVEWLTDELEAEAQKIIDKIDEMGGIIRAIELGYPQKEIGDASYHYQKQLDRHEKIIVGMNKYIVEEEIPLPLLKIDPEVERRQVANLKEVRAGRDQAAVDKHLAKIEEVARDGGNLMEQFVGAVRVYCTQGEIIDTLKKVFGEHKDPGML
ncbi:MAG: methylmalonyl-CoA mutase family protein [Deltaproteobacteria bacterium]|nr:methylmalonyl-CoA mutase family protein [Deltaproteobacteria bacterium]